MPRTIDVRTDSGSRPGRDRGSGKTCAFTIAIAVTVVLAAQADEPPEWLPAPSDGLVDALETIPLPLPEPGPSVLGDPAVNAYDLAGERPVVDPLYRYPTFPTAGFSGASSVLPEEQQETSHFVPMEDRWRIGLQPWDRYGRGHPRLDDYPYALGNIFNPYTQNLLKEDFPIIGQHDRQLAAGSDARHAVRVDAGSGPEGLLRQPQRLPLSPVLRARLRAQPR